MTHRNTKEKIMVDRILTVSLYNENCTMAGRPVPQSKLESCDNEYSDSCGDDWRTWEGTAAELLAEADDMEGNGRCSQYISRCANELREAAYWEDPSLRTEPEADDE